MHSRVLAGAGGAVLVASLLVPALPATAAIEPPALPIVRPTSELIDMPTSYPVQQPLPLFPDDPTDASINRGVIPYDEIAPFINNLMDFSNRVSAQVVGKSGLGRDIYLVTVTGRETPEETAQQLIWRDKVKYDPTAAAVDAELQAGYKVPIWFNGNIHGNEWEGTDATLNYIRELATSTSPEVEELVESSRLYFTVVNNPDGRALGQRAVAAGYDPNRDMITGATSETAIIRDLSSIIQPTYFIDLHGYTNVLQVEPCGPPHGENYEYDLFLPHAYAAALAVEQAVVAANIPGNTYLSSTGGTTTENTGKIKIPYRDIRQGWDDWPPIFTPQYIAYQGGITNTVELPLGRANPATNPVNKDRSAINIQVADVVIKSIVGYVTEHRDDLLTNQMEIFRRGIAGEPSVVIPADISAEDLPEGVPTEWTEIWDETDVYNADYPRSYVIPVGGGQRSETDAERLVQQLLVHDIQVDRATVPFTADGTEYPAGSYLVDMHQPLRGLANVLLDEGTDISERVGDMYDISAWSLSLTWGADVVSVGSTADPALGIPSEDVTALDPSGDLPAAGTYLAFEPRGVAEWQAVNELLAEGVPLSQLPDGTILLGPDEASYAAAAAVADVFGVDFMANDGKALRDGPSKALDSLNVAFTGAGEDRDMLAKLGFTATQVSATTITSGAVNLADFDMLWIGSALSFTGQQTAGTAAVNAYVASGKPVVGRGSGIASFVNTFGITTAGSSSASGSSNGIVNVTTKEDGVLGSWPQDTSFVSPAVRFTGLGSNAVVEQTYAGEDLFVSGWWPTAARAAFVDQPAAVSAVGPSGSKAFLFGTSVTYRNHPIGAFSDIARAMYWASTPAETGVVAPGPDIERLAGDSRYTTAVEVSKAAFPETASVVYIATGVTYPDALSAGPAAAFEGGPLLLVKQAEIPAAVAAEIERLQPERIVVVGGTPSVSSAVFEELEDMTEDIDRIAGKNRYETSLKIAQAAFGEAELAYIATGQKFPDALSAGAAAGVNGAPVVLVDGTASDLDAGTAALLDGLGVESVKVLGAKDSVSSGIYEDLGAIASTKRIAGANRYETSQKINADAFDEATRVFLSTGLNFPDALAGSAAAATLGAPLYVIPGTCVPQAVLDDIAGFAPSTVTLLGGTPSLSVEVESLTPCS